MAKHENRKETPKRRGRVGRPRKSVHWPDVLTEAVNECPKCGSTRNKCYKTERLTPTIIKRLRKCLFCGTITETHQQVSDVDII